MNTEKIFKINEGLRHLPFVPKTLEKLDKIISVGFNKLFQSRDESSSEVTRFRIWGV